MDGWAWNPESIKRQILTALYNRYIAQQHASPFVTNNYIKYRIVHPHRIPAFKIQCFLPFPVRLIPPSLCLPFPNEFIRLPWLLGDIIVDT